MTIFNNFIRSCTLIIMGIFIMRFATQHNQQLAKEAYSSEQQKHHVDLNTIKIQPQHNKHNRYMEMHNIREFFEYVEIPTKTCNHLAKFGGSKENPTDGEKVVCLDNEFDINPNNCTVYSFGIWNEWSFDDAMALFGCQIYAFDPTMNRTNHKRGDRINFFNIGIGGKDGYVYINKKLCEVKRLTSIMKLLGHEDGVMIDYLKMDVEGAEILFLKDVLQNSPQILQKIKQIGMEIHPGKYSKSKIGIFKKHYSLFKQLESHGFRLYSSTGCPYRNKIYHLHELGRNVNGYYELVWGLWHNNY